MKLLIIALIISLVGLTGVARAEMEEHNKDHKGHQMMDHSSKKADTKEVKIEDVGNKTCPITGSPVTGKDFVVYKEKRYGTCCSGCDKEFLKDPEKYIKILKNKGEIK